MKRSTLFIALITAANLASAAPWTYRGTLNDGGKPANGNYDFRLTLVDAAGTASVSQPITLNNVQVKDGSFAAELDFGFDLSNAPAMKLKTEVQQNGSGFASLGEPSTFDAKAALAGICWDTTGNVVTAGEFLGSSNAQPVDIRANNLRAARFQADGTPSNYGDAPRVALGSSANIASAPGATVSGGGSTLEFDGTACSGCRNTADGFFSTAGGGTGNNATGSISTVGGGSSNVASGQLSTVAGGSFGKASGRYSAVSGGLFNCAGGDYSWAGGNRGKVRPPPGTLGPCTFDSGDSDGDNGTFLWADDQLLDFISTGPRQFLVRAGGGMAINTNTPTVGAALTVAGNASIPAAALDFGATTRQMINLWGGPTGYGIGVQDGRQYFRVPNTAGFDWFVGGVHSNTTDSPGAGGTWRMHLGSVGNLLTSTGTIGTLSDARLKDHVVDYTHALDRINALRPVNYHYKAAGTAAFQPEGTHVGFIAQEMQQVFPDWVLQGDDGYLQLSMRGFEAVAVRAMQELSAENAALKQSDTELRARLDALEARLK